MIKVIQEKSTSMLIYSVDMNENVQQYFVYISRILEDIPDYYRKHKDDKVQFDMNRFIHDKQYGYHLEVKQKEDGLEESIEK